LSPAPHSHLNLHPHVAGTAERGSYVAKNVQRRKKKTNRLRLIKSSKILENIKNDALNKYTKFC